MYEPRTCPACLCKLEPVKQAGTVIDICPQCDGLFLDRGEIEALARGLKGKSCSLKVRPGEWLCPSCGKKVELGVSHCKKCGSRVSCICPGCKSTMKVEEICDIQIDICPTCLGMWFDSGELEDLLDEVKDGHNYETDSHSPSAGGTKKKKGKKKKKSHKKLKKAAGAAGLLAGFLQLATGLFDFD